MSSYVSKDVTIEKIVKMKKKEKRLIARIPGVSLSCGGYPSTCVPVKDTTIRILATIVFIVTPNLSYSIHKIVGERK